MKARLSKDPRNQVIGVLKAGSTLNDIAHHFGCSKKTIHDLIKRNNRTASVRVRKRPGRARVTMLRPHRVTLKSPTYSFQQTIIIAQTLRGSYTKDN